MPVTRLSAFLAAAAVLAGVLSGCGPSQSSVPSSAAPRTQTGASGESGDTFGRIPAIVKDVGPSVVTVLVDGSTGQGEGAGVIWRADGLIVTNNHVVENASAIKVVFASGDRMPATVVGTDPLTDLAVIRVERADLPAADFADGLPEIGQLAVAIGSPLGFEETVSAGIVSGIHRNIPSGGQTPALVDLLQTDAAISPGNSGGALVGPDGKVVGINVAYIPPAAQAVSIGFAIPSPTVVDVVPQLIASGKVRHAFLGIRPADLTPELARQFGITVQQGVIVLDVVPGSPSAREGLKPGDVIVALSGRETPTVEDLYAALREHEPGERVTVAIVRDGSDTTRAVTLTSRPS